MPHGTTPRPEMLRNKGTKTKYTFKGRQKGRYFWSSDEGDMCCGVKYFWNPKGAPFKMALTRLERVNVIAGALWGTKLSRDVRSVAIDIEDELNKMGYTLIKKRYDDE